MSHRPQLPKGLKCCGLRTAIRLRRCLPPDTVVRRSGSATGLVHSVRGTSGSVNVVVEANALLHGEETEAWGDAGYQGVAKRPYAKDGVRWNIAMRPGKRRQLDKTKRVEQLIGQLERIKASIRAKVEHPFRAIERQFGHVKVRYRGLKKDTAQLHTLFALSSLWMARRSLIRAHVGQPRRHVARHQGPEGVAAGVALVCFAHHLEGQQRVFELADRVFALRMVVRQAVQHRIGAGVAAAQLREQPAAFLWVVQALRKLVKVEQHRAQRGEAGQGVAAPVFAEHQHDGAQHG